MQKRLILIILAFGISLSGCGGGGGGSSAAPNPQPANQAPTVNAGADQSVDEETSADLSATGADSDGTIVSYSWQQESGTAVTITNADMANASFVAPLVAASEVLVFRVTVTDDDGATASDTVSITVNDTNPPPPPPPTGDDFIPLGVNSSAADVSADGSVVVGNSDGPFRWTAAAGMVGLGDLPGGGTESYASGASADGSVVVGRGSSASGLEAFRWTAASGMVGLGELPGGLFESRANGVSADGSVVVGRSRTDDISANEAFVWTQDNGMQSLRDMLIASGVTGLDDWELHEASGISADGQWVVGNGINPLGEGEAFLADISAP
jgi:probable HAF family extracellular repeat protein